MYRKTYIEVNLDRLEENIESIIKNHPEYQYYIGVVKGNCYGHGSYLVNSLIKKGVNYLAVSSLEEGIKIRKYHTDIPILCLEPISLDAIEIARKQNITLTISSLAYLENLTKQIKDKKLKMHLKLNTGMNRLGIKDKKDVQKAIDIIQKNYFLEGVYSHFITTGISDKKWDEQLQTFYDLLEGIDLTKIPMIHMGRSLTLVNHPKIDICNGIRLGILMYGFNQSPKKDPSFKGKLRQIKANLRIKKYHISKTTLDTNIKVTPCLSLYSEIMEIQNVKKGENVGYGLSYEAKEDILVAVAPIGYADGLNRKSTGRNVFINGSYYPIIGSVNMGMIQIKVDENVKVGDKVELIGDHVSARYVASYLHTTPYEVLCALEDTIPKKYLYRNEVTYIEE